MPPPRLIKQQRKFFRWLDTEMDAAADQVLYHLVRVCLLLVISGHDLGNF